MEAPNRVFHRSRPETPPCTHSNRAGFEKGSYEVFSKPQKGWDLFERF
jgi:hypothetical protein